MTHPGVGPLTALAFVLIIGKVERFHCGKQIASYLGLVPLEHSSGKRRRLGQHYQTGEFDVALFAGAGCARHGAQPAAMAQPVLPPHDAARTKDRQSRLGPETGYSLVLDVAQAMGLPAAQKVRFARGAARKLQWCAVEHRLTD
jgi:Transposase IS116/IS110/IS902 family